MSPRDWVGCQDLTNALVVLNQQFLHLLLLYEHIMHIYLKNIRVYTLIYIHLYNVYTLVYTCIYTYTLVVLTQQFLHLLRREPSLHRDVRI